MRKRVCITCREIFEPEPETFSAMCADCRNQPRFIEMQRLAKNMTRAQGCGAPATLTLNEWLQTLDDWGWQCAYCGGPYQVFEHFYSIRDGGGTTPGNCVPACGKCNVIKGNKISADQMSAQLERVDAYLDPKRMPWDKPIEYLADSDQLELESIFEFPREEVLEQRTIKFAGDDVILARCMSGIYITVPGMCRAMGLASNKQIRRIMNTIRLRAAARTLSIRTRGGFQDVTCLNVDGVSGWLIGIESAKAKPAFQAKIEVYHDKFKPQTQRAFTDTMNMDLVTSSTTSPQHAL